MSKVTGIEYTIFRYENNPLSVVLDEYDHGDDSDFTLYVWNGDSLVKKKEYTNVATSYDDPMGDLFTIINCLERVLGLGKITELHNPMVFVNELKNWYDNDATYDVSYPRRLINGFIWRDF